MCGLFGIVSTVSAVNYERALFSLHKIAHRGPDQWGEYREAGIFVGHRRLSIMDLSESGRQPMVSDDNSVVVTVNGEIYNYKILRSELEKTCRFTSHSDSEVVLHGFKVWGLQGLLDRLDGMYAIVIFERKDQRIHIIRDRFGIKPLYYAWDGNQLLWASELKCIEHYLNGQLEQDNEAIYDFLTYRYIPPPKTVWRKVFKLEAAHRLSFSIANRNLDIFRYWQLEVDENNGSDFNASIEDDVHNELASAVQSHLMSDAGVNFFLSGGIDSSLLVAFAAKYLSTPKTFNIGMTKASFDESEYANIISETLNTKHYMKVLNQNYSGELFVKLRDWFDEPFADLSAIPTFMLCEMIKDSGEKVVVGGDGADEVFGGYARYFHSNIDRGPGLFSSMLFRYPYKLLASLDAKSKAWRLGRYCGQKGVFSGLHLYATLIGALPEEQRKAYRTLYAIPQDYDDYWFFNKYYCPELPTLTRLQYLDMHTYLPEDILAKLDRVSMAVSIEARVPYLSRSLVERVFSIPENLRNPGKTSKYMLKSIARQYLPEQIIGRKKKGFGLPKEYRYSKKDGRYIYEQVKVLQELYPELCDG